MIHPNFLVITSNLDEQPFWCRIYLLSVVTRQLRVIVSINRHYSLAIYAAVRSYNAQPPTNLRVRTPRIYTQCMRSANTSRFVDSLRYAAKWANGMEMMWHPPFMNKPKCFAVFIGNNAINRRSHFRIQNTHSKHCLTPQVSANERLKGVWYGNVPQSMQMSLKSFRFGCIHKKPYEGIGLYMVVVGPIVVWPV